MGVRHESGEDCLKRRAVVAGQCGFPDDGDLLSPWENRPSGCGCEKDQAATCWKRSSWKAEGSGLEAEAECMLRFPSGPRLLGNPSASSCLVTMHEGQERGCRRVLCLLIAPKRARDHFHFMGL